MRDAPGNFNLLHRTCSLVVLLCFLHISVTVIYYMRNSDLRQTFVQNQQSPQIHRKLAEQRVTTEESPQRLPSVSNVTETERKLETCPDNPPRLVGPLRVEFSDPVTLDLVRSENQALQPGGRFKPTECIAQQKVAIIIPFRHRDEHLKYWLYYLHPILQRQQLDYGIYVINQRPLRLGKGETSACSFSGQSHYASLAASDEWLPYAQYFGGVSSLSKEQYLKINGFPNNYWGWGGEDDDIFNRVSSKGMSISRPDGVIGRCRMIRHDRDKQNDPNPQRFDRIAHTRETMASDGISSLTYNVVNIEKDQLFTKITVDVGKP
ncbi:beta-1,4-galactosyltransferase 1-like isoform X2 [Sinocyclocheilus rhinocerous]|uniref:beta-1,4-galactosyltransferase 1-like isoform X2 n=1 Tax=Sinocyclocheilus rhinocerous TaxID=307959 RepID=UPI0007B8409B|nr:PREDICTED: beta-1,4-galactosyltransferase 1-like isoform X2 [Sinocyclocheilus rhinocerous]